LFARRGFLPLLIVIPVMALLLQPHYPLGSYPRYVAWMTFCAVIALAGQAIRFITIAHVPLKTSGRNRREQVAESLNTDGMYSVVRNPLYLGNCLSWLGLAAIPCSPTLWLLVLFIFWLYHERVIFREEAFLESKFGDVFRTWAERTPVFLPSPRRAASRLRYSFRYVGRGPRRSPRRTGPGAHGCGGPFGGGRPLQYTRAGFCTTVIFIAFVGIRWLRKNTPLFRVEGRTW
jgi:protein-S-isoprenylcysteine O-methyltransferase Ste14